MVRGTIKGGTNMKDYRELVEDYNEVELTPQLTEELTNEIPSYEVYVFPYDKDHNILSRGSKLVCFSDDPKVAVDEAKKYIAGINKQEEKDYFSDEEEQAAYITVEVETVVKADVDYFENIMTIFEAEIKLD